MRTLPKFLSFIRIPASLATAGLLSLSPSALAQNTPLHLSTSAPLIDEFGKRLEGTHEASSDFGVPHVPGDVIQILDASQGVFPPSITGAPHPLMPVLHTVLVGAGSSPSLDRSAQFATSLLQRPSVPFIVRVFNAPSTDDASFYVDSETFSAANNARLFPKFVQTDRPIDDGDEDQDGLHNSWEKSLGTDPNKSDSDGDGVSDGSEHFARTDPLDPASLLHLSEIRPDGEATVLSWQSIPALTYEIHCTEKVSESSFTNIVATVVATGDVCSVSLNTSAEQSLCYRVARVTP